MIPAPLPAETRTAILTGIELPVTPPQILWINMTTASLLGLMVAFEPNEPGSMGSRS